jgi:hypothetical protein
MKKSILWATALLAAGTVLADPKDDVTAAVKKLADASNYSWKTTPQTPAGGGGGGGGGGGRFRPGPSEGKAEKDGYIWVSMTRGDNTTEMVKKGEKGAAKTQDGWQSLADLAADDQGPGRFMAGMIRNYRTPAVELSELVGKVKEFKADGGVVSADLPEEVVKPLLTFGGRRGGGGGGGGPEVSNAKGSIKFWLKDGNVAKYELKVAGTVSFNGNDRDVDRTTDTEIKDVGATTVTVPDEAKSKLN